MIRILTICSQQKQRYSFFSVKYKLKCRLTNQDTTNCCLIVLQKRKKKVESDDTFDESSPIKKPGGSRARKAVSYAIKSDDSDSD